MRVTTGKYGGRNLYRPNSSTIRPTMDKVKKSLFDFLADKVKDAFVLDLFAGSGALGIEAVSRGASEVVFVDKDNFAADAIKKNAKTIGLANYKVYDCDFLLALKNFKKQGMLFDIIFIDPPYHKNFGTIAIDAIVKYNLLKNDGMIVFETNKKEFADDRFQVKKLEYSGKNIFVLSFFF